MMAREMSTRVVIMGLLVLLLAMLVRSRTMQSRIGRPLQLHNNVERRINGQYSRYFRYILILSSAADEKLLLESEFFRHDDTEDSIHEDGRIFHFGYLADVQIIYVVDLTPSACLAVTMHSLYMFKWLYIDGIIDYGNAATISDSVKLGDVAVISEAAFTSAWTWKEIGSKVDANKPSLKFGDYNEPRKGRNKLGSIEYNKVVQYKPHWAGTSSYETFWHPTDPEFFEYASELEDMNLPGRSCIGEICTNASVVHGVRAASSDAYVQNFAYGQFLNKEFNASIIDMKSAATISLATSYAWNHIVFRAASSRPGEKEDPEVSALARENSLKVVIEYLELVTELGDEESSTSNNVLRLKKY